MIKETRDTQFQQFRYFPRSTDGGDLYVLCITFGVDFYYTLIRHIN